MPAEINNQITFRDLVIDMWRVKYFVLSLMVVVGVAGAVAGLIMKKKYDASITILPTSADDNLSRKGALSGLVSLAGIGVQNNSAKDEAVAMLRSERLTENYIRDNNLLPKLYAKQWDVGRGQWKSSDPSKMPTVWKASQYFKKNVRSITEDSKTGVVVMTIKWTDPTLAAAWANGLVSQANTLLRDRAVRESERNIAYLNGEAAKTGLIEVRNAIYALLQQELSTEMLAKGREEYALRTIDPAVIPEKPSSPTALLLSVLGAVVGLFLAFVIVLVKRAMLPPFTTGTFA